LEEVESIKLKVESEDEGKERSERFSQGRFSEPAKAGEKQVRVQQDSTPATERELSRGAHSGTLPSRSLIDSLISNYKTIRAELKQHGHGLAEKPETIILTKTDTVDANTVSLAIKELSKLNEDILNVSILDEQSIKEIKDEIVRRLRNVK
jgi:hypothetical protein